MSGWARDYERGDKMLSINQRQVGSGLCGAGPCRTSTHQPCLRSIECYQSGSYVVMLDQDWAVWQRIVAAGWCGLTGGGGVSQHISVGWGTPPGQGLLVTAIICEIVRLPGGRCEPVQYCTAFWSYPQILDGTCHFSSQVGKEMEKKL